ncbi:MAG TPA: penicillin-insensitive murein endopeptidase [Polyangiaceae bacterium]|nr:penicillin-insensitive murein endopeptidase [Polyangiaceae bacterium]
MKFGRTLPLLLLLSMPAVACVRLPAPAPQRIAAPALPPPPVPVAAAPSPMPPAPTPPPMADAVSCYPIPGRPPPPGCPVLGEDHEDDEVDAEHTIDDDVESEQEAALPTAGEHPLARVTDAEVARRVRKNPAELGPMSIGYPNQGRLFNGVRMPSGPHWQVVDPSHAWGTQETVDALTHAIEKVNQAFADTPRVVIGHISAKQGGRLAPHVSHQAGRDVDVGYYHDEELRWFARAGSQNLDRARTWELMKTLARETRVDLILIDRSIQKLLREWAKEHGEPEELLREMFEGGAGKRAIVLHARGHADHIHVRFFNPIAQETGRRAGPVLLKMGLLKAPQKAPPAVATTMIVHRVVRGETLGMIARKYGVTVQQIRAANGLFSDRVKPKQELRIPKAVTSAPTPPARAPGKAKAPARSASPTPRGRRPS